MGWHKQSLGTLRSVEKRIKALDFLSAYDELSAQDYMFSFENLSRDFSHIDALTMYSFLMFSISMNETVDKHLAVCHYLYFMNPYICGADMLIKWHLLQALNISPGNREVLLNWVFGVYNGNPDSPFSSSELEHFRKQLPNP